MSDPIRLLDEPRLVPATARALILAGKRLSPPAGADDRGWQAISALLGSNPFPSSGGSNGSPAAGGSSGSPAASSGSGTTNGGGGLSGGEVASNASSATFSAPASAFPLLPAVA